MTALPSTSTSENTAQRSRTAYEAVIERIFEHTADTRSLFLRLPAEQSLVFKPGQFLSLLLPVAGQELTRPYSIASDPEDGNVLEICFNLVPGGLGSQYLFERKEGEALHFTGPWGTFVLDQPPQTECVFIADGPSIAPIRPMIRRALLSGTGVSIRLLYGAVQETSLLYRSELYALAQSSDRFCFESLLYDPPTEWRGLCGTLPETVKRQYIDADSDRSRHFYICGVGNQVTLLRDLLRQAGYQRRAVQYEKW